MEDGLRWNVMMDGREAAAVNALKTGIEDTALLPCLLCCASRDPQNLCRVAACLLMLFSHVLEYE